MGEKKVSLLVRCPCFNACKSGRVGNTILCPQFKGVLIEVFHCILIKEHLLQLIIGTSEWTIGSDGQFGKPSN